MRTMFFLLLLQVLRVSCTIAGFRARLPARLGFRSGTPVLVAASTDGAAAEAALLRQAALTDRGLRASALDKSQLQMLIRRLESLAPDASALDLNGEWRLALALGETPYRSSPFFWAFRQAAAGATTPVAVPGAEVAAGDSLASAIYGVTDTLPFYDIGNVVQRISGLCSDVDGCKIEEEDDEGFTSDGVQAASEPNDGDNSPLPSPSTDVGSLESVVQLTIGRLFGISTMESQMTTAAEVRTLARTPSDRSGVVEVELQIQTTAAKQSTIASVLPALEDALKFPSGAALELIKKRSSFVRLRTTYVSDTLRISRPVLEGVANADAVFVYSRM
jgi:hypothetical protein